MKDSIQLTVYALLVGIFLLLYGCASPGRPPSTDPQTPFGTETHQVDTHDFSILADTDLPPLSGQPHIDSKHVYSLPELIDIAERTNPETRIAWERARQAAFAVGISRAAYLPVLSAQVLSGYAKTSAVAPGISLPPIEIPDGVLTTSGNESVSNLTLDWLLFDFGGRQASVGAAKDLSYAANVEFNGSHQKLIYEVSRAYYQLAAARLQTKINRDALENTKTILKETKARRKSGIATTMETAQAQQQVAQAEFDLAQAEGTENDTYSDLLDAMGIAPTTTINVEDIGKHGPPRHLPHDLDRLIAKSLERRPDVVAALAKAKADEKGIAVAEAKFLPKIWLRGAYSRANGKMDISDSRLSRDTSIDMDQPNESLMLGLTIPLYDGGTRSMQLKSARANSAASQQEFIRTQNFAARQIVVAYNTLNTSLSAYVAASELVKASATTYDAALDYYRHGLGTLSKVSAAQNGLLKARLSKAKMLSDSLTAAVSLAFYTGTLTNADTADHL